MTYFTEMCEPNSGCFTLDQIKALLNEKYPINTLYDYYIKSDDGGYDDLYEAVNYRLEALVSRNNEEQNKKSMDKSAR